MGVYDNQIANAQRQIAAKGQLVTWIPQNVIVNGGQPWKITAGSNGTTYPVSIVFVAAGSSGMGEILSLFKGTSVPDDALVGLMGAVTFVPGVADTVLRGTENLIVKSIGILSPNGTPILYAIEFIG